MNKENLKIVQLASGDLWAGAEVQLFTLTKYLNRDKNISIKVILLNDGDLARKLRVEGIEIAVFDESKLNSFQIYSRISNQLKCWSPDVVHTHRQKENILGGIAARLNHIHSVRTVHGAIEHRYGWREPHKKIISRLDNLVGKYLQQQIISVSKELTKKLIAIFSEDKIKTIENGVDLKLLEPFIKNNRNIFENTPIKIGLVGRLVPVKQVDRLIDAANILINGKYKNNIQFQIYGDGPLRHTLQQQINRLKLDAFVFLMGHEDNVFGCIKNLDLLLLTSAHEGLPMTLLEALGIGTPVIATDVGCIADVFVNESCGTLILDDSPTCIAQTIVHNLVNKEEVRIKAERGRLRVGEKYSAIDNATNYTKLYNTLVESLAH